MLHDNVSAEQVFKEASFIGSIVRDTVIKLA